MTESSMNSEDSSKFDRDEWIRRASFEEFSNFMAAEYGAGTFNLAFQAINENKQLIYADDENY